MTELLEQAISVISQLPDEQQDAIATQLLKELDEMKWQSKLDATTDLQWKNLAAMVRQDIASGDVVPLNEIFK